MQLIKPLCWILVATCLGISPIHAAEDQHGDHKEAQHDAPETKGPHGGLLLQQNGATVELQIFEQGVPPVYRAWVTTDETPVTDDIDLNVQLTRLGGQVDNFDFAFQGDYWQGNGVVTEPHSFDVQVTLALNGKRYQWQWESHEGRTRIAADIAESAGIRTAEAGPGSIERTLTAYGRLTTAPEQMARVRARFPGVITRVDVRLGDRVVKGDRLAQVESNESLKTYDLRSPIGGVVSERTISVGEITGEQPLLAITDLTTLWADLQIFPGQRNKLAVDQKVHLKAEGVDRQATVNHLLPSSDNAPYTLARVEVENTDGALSPGLLVAGDIVVERLDVPLAVDNRALQSFRDWTVVFVQVDDTYEIRPLELGLSDSTSTEVLGGLQVGDRYVVENSYLIKADLEKSGASHDH
ncbi:MAG: efflux RND transporter periplasmic adaptor subunit [Pseudomonas sp.]|uniref:Efflux RND transporter periplasmic adaptor subunit n=2 Tax=Halopseudomonas TaxID=2901189 RepID=A0A4U0YI07_9GAMM|nr:MULTISPECIES: efflux RND transporter periplasmic adaptor subunit [Halopseudomonas]TKA91630.1 efflux RND transporter periplasmic adaptor subunit [Halopseudomonas bauzanensis]SDT03730.1 membrane fusion protein, cobalt-zinc-cadmium efflux system [Halopseudomonas litoralis]